jgi:fructose-1,6-bisphosphatase/inositol monophosphatase family enzyme
MTYSHGPLPSGWSYKSPYLTDEEGYQRHVIENGRIDRNKVATVLENHGYLEHARMWYLSPLEAAAPEMLVAAKGALAALTQNKTFPADIAAAKSFLQTAIAKAEGR